MIFEGLIMRAKNWEVKQKEKSGEAKVDSMNPAHQEVKDTNDEMELQGIKVSHRNRLIRQMAKEKMKEAKAEYKKSEAKELQEIRDSLRLETDDKKDIKQVVKDSKERLELDSKFVMLNPSEPYKQVKVSDYPNSLYQSVEERLSSLFSFLSKKS